MERSKHMHSYKLIYVFSIPYNTHKGLLKVGETTINTVTDPNLLTPGCDELNRAANARIGSYTNTASIDYSLLYTELAVRKEFSFTYQFNDKDVHQVLTNSGIAQIKPNGNTGDEWFKADIETIKKAIKAVKKWENFITFEETCFPDEKDFAKTVKPKNIWQPNNTFLDAGNVLCVGPSWNENSVISKQIINAYPMVNNYTLIDTTGFNYRELSNSIQSKTVTYFDNLFHVFFAFQNIAEIIDKEIATMQTNGITSLPVNAIIFIDDIEAIIDYKTFDIMKPLFKIIIFGKQVGIRVIINTRYIGNNKDYSKLLQETEIKIITGCNDRADSKRIIGIDSAQNLNSGEMIIKENGKLCKACIPDISLDKFK